MTQEMLSIFGTRHITWLKQLLTEAGIANVQQVVEYAEKSLRHASDRSLPSTGLEQAWYYSLRSNGRPDYSVYAHDAYLGELWLCWSMYSRGYLVNIQRSQSLPPTGVVSVIRGHGAIVDLGNGIGLTTAALKQIFAESEVIGTNLPNTSQWSIASVMARRFGFGMVAAPSDIKCKVGMVFASEYFEHFESPLEHLQEVVDALSPRAMLIANAFSADAIGHFDDYKHCGISIGKRTVGRRFNELLRSLGYSKVKTCLWNNRPSLWIRSSL